MDWLGISKIPSPPLQMGSLARCLGGCIFSSSRANCIFFFQFTFWYIWNSVNLAYVSQFGVEDLVYNYRFTPQIESHSVPDIYGLFCFTFSYFIPFGVIENRVTKINCKYSNGNCDLSSCPGWSILFSYAPAYKGVAFWKNYLWARLSLS